MPNIVSANYTEEGAINVVVVDHPPGLWISVPPDEGNKDYVAIQAWVAEGNTIAPYVPPPEADPEPTIQDVMVLVDDLAKRVAALERKKPK